MWESRTGTSGSHFSKTAQKERKKERKQKKKRNEKKKR